MKMNPIMKYQTYESNVQKPSKLERFIVYLPVFIDVILYFLQF